MSEASIPVFVMPKRKNRKRVSTVGSRIGKFEKQIAAELEKPRRRRKNPISWPLRGLRFTPQLPKGRPRLVQSLSSLARPLGAAFEYVVRAQLQRINPNAVTGLWVAEEALDLAQESLNNAGHLKAESEDFIEGWSGRPQRVSRYVKEPHKLLADLRAALDQTRILDSRYIDDGVLSTELLEGYLKLARWHGLFIGTGAFVVPYEWNQVDPRAVFELRAMFDLVKWEQFKAKRRCLLRPQFRFSSKVGRFEADLVIDDMLIDLKATDSASLDRRDIDQLLGYFALAEIEGLKGRRKGGINKLVLYYPRFGDSLVIDLKRDYPQEKIEKYLEWYRLKCLPKTRIA